MTRLLHLFEVASGSAGWADAQRISVAGTGGAADPAELMESAGMVLAARDDAGAAIVEQEAPAAADRETPHLPR